ncbi:MAG: hydrogenase maturation nickel metallochaperone HypA [Candidatus Limnocylindrales bacterium]
MHEVGLVDGIVEAVLRRAGERPVARFRVRIGTLHRASQGPMDQALELVAAGTNLDGAVMELIQVPVTMTCRTCGVAAESEDLSPVCTSCGSTELDHQGGDELVLESVEYAGPAVAVSTAG